MKAWVFQDPKQVQKKGVEAASWYVGWFDPEGKKRCTSCGPGSDGHRRAIQPAPACLSQGSLINENRRCRDTLL
jgi:hypothetical protein